MRNIYYKISCDSKSVIFCIHVEEKGHIVTILNALRGVVKFTYIISPDVTRGSLKRARKQDRIFYFDNLVTMLEAAKELRFYRRIPKEDVEYRDTVVVSYIPQGLRCWAGTFDLDCTRRIFFQPEHWTSENMNILLDFAKKLNDDPKAPAIRFGKNNCMFFSDYQAGPNRMFVIRGNSVVSRETVVTMSYEKIEL